MALNHKRILVIEDDEHIFALIKATLKTYQVHLELAEDGEKGLEKALLGFDLIILDIMLPEMSGWEVCKELRQKEVETPIIMLTAKVEEMDKVLGLEMGADDYITKPFSPRELVARMKAILRRFETSQKDEDRLYFSAIDLTIDGKKYLVQIGDERIDLSPKEFELFFFLASHPGQVFKREQILNQIWDYATTVKTRTVDEHIKRLRQKLDEAGLKKPENVIRTLWGVGYTFEVDEDEEKA